MPDPPKPSAQKIRNAQRHVDRAKEDLREARQKQKATKLLHAFDAGYLEAEDMEKTYKFTQEAILPHLDMVNQAKIFDLSLETFAPYSIDYSRSGRSLLIGGHKGHIASFDWKTGRLMSEIHVKETVRDVCFMHNESMYAVAQKENVYIYDHTGIELHSLKRHHRAHRITFLPYHFLLGSIGDSGILRYQDITTGEIAAEHRTHLGTTRVLAQNPWNAVLHCGHGNGTVSLWSPNMASPLVKMLCHRGEVTAVAIDSVGKHMVTAGVDGRLKVFDIRTFKPMTSYYTPRPASALSISQKGLVGVSWTNHVVVWKDMLGSQKIQSPYMTHRISNGQIADLQFAPFEDALGIGHSRGFSSIVIPGAGEPNYDALEVNPYASRRQKREQEIKSLIEKLPADSITLDPDLIGGLASKVVGTKASIDQKRKEANLEGVNEEEEKTRAQIAKERREQRKLDRMNGITKYLKKQKNIIHMKKEMMKQKLDEKPSKSVSFLDKIVKISKFANK